MKLGSDEQQLAEYTPEKDKSAEAPRAVVTSRRLVYISRPRAQVSFPLSQIKAVYIGFHRLPKYIILGCLLALAGLGAVWRFESLTAPGLILAGVGAIIAFIGWRGEMALIIRQASEDLTFPVKGRNVELEHFAHKLSSALE